MHCSSISFTSQLYRPKYSKTECIYNTYVGGGLFFLTSLNIVRLFSPSICIDCEPTLPSERNRRAASIWNLHSFPESSHDEAGWHGYLSKWNNTTLRPIKFLSESVSMDHSGASLNSKYLQALIPHCVIVTQIGNGSEPARGWVGGNKNTDS